MPLYEMDQVGKENQVFVSINNKFGSKTIGNNFVTFSGCGKLKTQDEYPITEEAHNYSDHHLTQFDVQITVGPKWKGVSQCSPLITPNQYVNNDADEDDIQAWSVYPCTWELVASQGGQRIRLKFSMGQSGQSTLFFGIGYQVTATGDLAS
jgi:hypothetical protein